MSDSKMRNALILMSMLFLILNGCKNGVFYHDIQTIENGIWKYDDPKSFTFSVEDTLTFYDLLVEVKHDKRFPYQNLYLQLITSIPEEDSVDDILSIDLADYSGNKYGACGRNQCTFQVPVQQSFKFEKNGSYEISISQHSRIDSLPGISAIGLLIKETSID